MTGTTARGPLKFSLLILRLTLGAFLLVWALEKVILPKATLGVFKRFYFSGHYGFEFTELHAQLLGIPQILLCLAILIGLWKTLSYGLGLVLHALSTASTFEYLIQPFGAPNHLFVAAVPVLAGFLVLFLMREDDTLLAVSRPAPPGG